MGGFMRVLRILAVALFVVLSSLFFAAMFFWHDSFFIIPTFACGYAAIELAPE
jgi:hypothetical protein